MRSTFPLLSPISTFEEWRGIESHSERALRVRNNCFLTKIILCETRQRVGHICNLVSFGNVQVNTKGFLNQIKANYLQHTFLTQSISFVGSVNIVFTSQSHIELFIAVRLFQQHHPLLLAYSIFYSQEVKLLTSCVKVGCKAAKHS